MNGSASQFHSGFYQRGAASLLVAMVVLATVTMITLYTSRTVFMEQKISTNEYRGRMAFEAAEAGSEGAIAYIRVNGRNADDDVHTSGVRDGEPWLPAEIDDDGNDIKDPDEFLFDSDGDGTNDTNTLTLGNGATAVVTLRDVSSGTTTGTEIVSTGYSEDNAAVRTITQTISLVSPLVNVPENPLLTRGNTVVNGSADIFNAEGHSTVWSGGPVDLGASGTVNTYIADPGSASYPDCLGDSFNPCDTLPSTTSAIAGLDVIEQDTSLANLSPDEYFENFFGKTPTDYRNSVVTLDLDPTVAADVNQINGATGEVIWVDGDLSLSAGTYIGCTIDPPPTHCPTANIKPVIMIVDGTLNMTGTIEFYGLLFVWDRTTGNGNPYLVGSTIVAGADSDMTGSFEIHYNSWVLESLAEEIGPPAASGNSWRDF